MKRLIVCVAFLSFAGAARAQVWGPLGAPTPPGRPMAQPISPPRAPSSSFDYQSGNMIHTSPTPGGGARVNGYNTNTGAIWNTEIKPNGNQSGMDASGNFWNYNAATKTYSNTNGTVCAGTGAARVCN